MDESQIEEECLTAFKQISSEPDDDTLLADRIKSQSVDQKAHHSFEDNMDS